MQHSLLNGMSSSKPSSQGSGIYLKEPEILEETGMIDIFKLIHIRTHRDCDNTHKMYLDSKQTNSRTEIEK